MALEALELLKHVPDEEVGGGGGGSDSFDGLMKKISSKRAMAFDQDDDNLGGPLKIKGISFASHSANQTERERSARVLAEEVLDALKTAPVPV